ncbi:MAG TPA: imidazolonepropionase [Candidatus Competibacteraceae bacterium]|nr:imidazolonepropionase [Candidatus Competibacteraceae bacterium]
MSTAHWDSVWLDVHLATLAEDSDTPYGAIEDGALAVQDGHIAWIGPRAELPELADTVTVHSGHGGWLTPGLIDCHTHLVYAGNRAREFELRLQGASYAEIAAAGGGILSTVRATRAASETELLAAAAPRLTALLAEGVTTVEIKSGYGLELESELKMLRVARRLGETHPVTVRTTLLGAHALPPEYAGRADDYIERVCREMIPTAAAEHLADAVDVFCERLAFDLPQTERVFQAALEHGLPVKLHAEQLSNLGGSVLAARYGALSVDHIEYLDEVGVRAIAAAGTVATLLPGAFYFLREPQSPPVELLRRHGVPMAIATDLNPGTSPFASLLLMLNMACTLFRLTPEEALRGATLNAARALGLGASHGSLELGKVADLALWDIGHPAELAYQFGTRRCRRVVKGGVVVSTITPC